MAKLGIADQVKPKIKLPNEAALAAVAKGEVEIGLGAMSEVLLVPGVRLAGRLTVLPGFHGKRVER